MVGEVVVGRRVGRVAHLCRASSFVSSSRVSLSWRHGADVTAHEARAWVEERLDGVCSRAVVRRGLGV